jgi:hypothetical protein
MTVGSEATRAATLARAMLALRRAERAQRDAKPKRPALALVRGELGRSR